MSDETTKANISIGDCVLEFKGSEAFVQKQIDEFKDLILGELKKAKSEKPKGKPPAGKKDQVDEKPDGSQFANYPNVIDYEEDTINILKVDGRNNADKTKNLCFIHLWAKEKFNKNPVPTQEIRKQCETHGCLDVPNFSTTLKKIDKKYVVVKGKGKSQTIKLTAPGRKKAKELIESLNEES